MSALGGSVFVFGLGLIGGSVAAAAKAAGYARVLGYDRDAAAAGYAHAHGLVDAIESDAAAAAAACDLTVIAVPVAAIPACVGALVAAARSRPGLAVTDAGSVKGSVVDGCRALLGGVPDWFVPGHPLAGSERTGVAAAQAALFAGRQVVLTPEPGVSAAALACVRAFWLRLGASVATMSAAEHDRIVALTSHLPHLVAFALADLFSDDPGQLRFGAGGLRDATRTAAADPALWRGIFAANAGQLIGAVDRLLERLQGARAALLHGDLDAVEAMCMRARVLRDGWSPP